MALFIFYIKKTLFDDILFSILLLANHVFFNKNVMFKPNHTMNILSLTTLSNLGPLPRIAGNVPAIGGNRVVTLSFLLNKDKISKSV